MTTQTQTAGPVNLIMLAGGAALVVSLGLAMANLMGSGHASFNTASNGVTWGLLVVTYVFFSMASTGLAMVAALAAMFDARQFAPLIKRCTFLSIITLVAAFSSLALEMGNPLRMLWAVPLNFQPGSALVWMGIFYSICLALLVFKFMKMHKGNWSGEGLTRTGFVLEVLALGTLGSAFGLMAMRPAWYGSEVPALFLACGAVIGVAFAVLITQLTYGMDTKAMPERLRSVMTGSLPKLFATTLGIYLVFLLFRTVNGLWTNADGFQMVSMMVKSPWFMLEVVALLGAFFIMTNPAMRAVGNMQVVAAVATLVAMFIGRYEYIIGGQLVPLFKGSWVHGLINYTPSTTEWLITIMAFSLVFAGWAYAEKNLNLAAEPGEK
jgi:Ni/Fe-hydrogenase subunit HybB-like protein